MEKITKDLPKSTKDLAPLGIQRPPQRHQRPSMRKHSHSLNFLTKKLQKTFSKAAFKKTFYEKAFTLFKFLMEKVTKYLHKGTQKSSLKAKYFKILM